MSLLRDLRHACRMLRRAPGFTATALLVLALGIGANTAVFSIVNAVLLRPLPYPDPDRLVQLITASPMGTGAVTSIPKFVTWRDQTTVFERIAAFHVGGPELNLQTNTGEQPVTVAYVSADYFKLFGVSIARGRTFAAEEDRPGATPVAVISHRAWLQRFGGDPSMVGRPIVLADVAYQLLGVLDDAAIPGESEMGADTDVWLPLRADPHSLDHTNYVQVVARLRRGATLRDAAWQLAPALTRFSKMFPFALGPRERFGVVPLRDIVVGPVRSSLRLLTGAVGLLLLIACANIASLLLARAHRRRGEITLRVALGAGRARIVRQLLTESLLLSGAGGLLGIAAGIVCVRLLLAVSPGHIPRLGDANLLTLIDARVLLFALLVSLGTGLLFGLAPALSASRVDLTSTFKEGHGASDDGGHLHHRVHALLVIGEIALALVLLAGSGLLIRTFAALRTADRGFDANQVLALDMSLAGASTGGAPFDRAAAIDALVHDVQRRAGQLSGVSALAVTDSLPLESGLRLPFRLERFGLFGSPYHGETNWRSVSPAYFEVFRIALRDGRPFDEHDTAAAEPVMLISETLANQYWPGWQRRTRRDEPASRGRAGDGDGIGAGVGAAAGTGVGVGVGEPSTRGPIGERLTLGNPVDATAGAAVDPPRRIIGIVADVRGTELTRAPEPMVYVPIAQVSDTATARNNRLRPLTWVVRTQGDPRPRLADLERALRLSSGGLPVGRVRVMSEVVAASTSRAAFSAMLLTLFASIALLLAGVGLYGLMNYSVGQRAREIGIRLALGAAPHDVRTLIVRQGLRLTLTGITFGTAAALLLTRLMVSLIYGVKTWDPLVFLTIATTLAAVTLLAAYLPARRATQLDPVRALRTD